MMLVGRGCWLLGGLYGGGGGADAAQVSTLRLRKICEREHGGYVP